MSESKHYQLKARLVPWLFVLPGILITIVFRYYTIFESFTWSFFNYNITNPPGTFVGLDNFMALFQSSDFIKSIGNTAVFLVLTVLLTFWVPIVQALFLSEIKKGRGIVSNIYIIPAVIPGTVSIVIWKWIWHPQYGLANALFSVFHLPAQQWLSDVNLVKFCIVFPGILGGGLTVLLYLSAIFGISQDIVEAAELDGCTGIKKWRYIILPNIQFLIKIQLIMMTITTLQIMDAIFQYTNGGPAGASDSIALNIYKLYNERFNYGQGSAAAALLLCAIALVTIFQMNIEKEKE